VLKTVLTPLTVNFSTTITLEMRRTPAKVWLIALLIHPIPVLIAMLGKGLVQVRCKNYE